MKKLYVMLLVVILTLGINTIVQAEDTGVHGSIGFRYELADENPGQLWVMDIHYNFFKSFGLGASQTTFTNGYSTYFNTILAFTPDGQLYEIYAVYRIGDSVEIKLCQWCLHAVYSGDMKAVIDSPKGEGVYLQGTYKF